VSLIWLKPSAAMISSAGLPVSKHSGEYLLPGRGINFTALDFGDERCKFGGRQRTFGFLFPRRSTGAGAPLESSWRRALLGAGADYSFK